MDDDGIEDEQDNCPIAHNADQVDVNSIHFVNLLNFFY